MSACQKSEAIQRYVVNANWIVIFIALAGFALRIVNILDQVPLTLDSHTVFEAKLMSHGPSIFPGTLKPLWKATVALGYSLLGLRLFVASIISVFSGTLAIALIYKLTERLFGKWSGVYAAATCASMLSFIHFSRWSQPQMTSMSLVLAAIVLYRPWSFSPRLKRVALFAAGMFSGITLFYYSGYVTGCMILIAWTIMDAVCGGRRWSKNSVRDSGLDPLVVLAGISAAVLTPEFIIRVARHVGFPSAASWVGSIWLEWGWHLGSGVPSVVSKPDYFHYWRVLSSWDGSSYLAAVVLCSIFMGVEMARHQSSRMFRGFSILWLPLAFVTAWPAIRAGGMDKYIVLFLPGVPIVLGCLIARAVQVSVLLVSRYVVIRPAAVAVVVCSVIILSGYQRGKFRIAWQTGHMAAYSFVRNQSPDYICFLDTTSDINGYSDWLIWEFYFEGMPQATLCSPEYFENLSNSAGLGIMVATEEGECGENQIESYEQEYAQWPTLSVLASVPSFDYRTSHDIDPTMHSLPKSLCHKVYSIGQHIDI